MGVVRRILDLPRRPTMTMSPTPRCGGRSSAAAKPRVGDEELTALLRAFGRAREGRGEAGAQLTAARAPGPPNGALTPQGVEEFDQILGRYLGAPPERSHGERVGLEFTLRKIWNVVPSPPEPISEAVRAALAEHFADDAAMRCRPLRG